MGTASDRLSAASSIIRETYHRLFCGRVSRTTFVIRAAILGAAIYILGSAGTLLAPSSKTLWDAYLALFFVMLAICLIGFVSAYVKRLHDIGLGGYWALVALIGIPAAAAWGISTYGEYRWRSDNSFNTADTNELAGWIFLGLPLLIALWKGEPDENRFGPVPQPVEHFTASRFNIVATVGAAAILIPTLIYAGFFQSGVWVGRGHTAPSMPMMTTNVDGRVFMKCWNVKGVGAGSGEGPLSELYRDGFEGVVFDFIHTPEGQIDIATAGGVMGQSYRAQGFKIIPYGLRDLNLYSQKLDRFMITAVYDEGGADSAVNYTTFVLGRNKNEDAFPSWNLVMTVGYMSSSGVDSSFLGQFPNARGKLMVGDCFPG